MYVGWYLDGIAIQVRVCRRKGIMDTETHVVREECGKSCTLDSGRYESTCQDEIQSTTSCVHSSTSVPAGQLISTNVLQKLNHVAVYSASKTSQTWMTGVEILHVGYTMEGGGWKSGCISPAWRSIHVAQSYDASANSNLKELKCCIFIFRVWEK